MTLIPTSPPALEPVALAEAKAHLRVDTAAEDLYIASLITTSRLQIETALSLALVAQAWSYFIDAWPRPGDSLTLPLTPVLHLDAIRTFAPDDTPNLIPLAAFQLDGHGKPARLLRRNTAPSFGAVRALNGIEIAFTAGFGALAADVPAPIRHALLMLVAHWYEHRDVADAEQPGTEIPQAISALLSPWRSFRLV